MKNREDVLYDIRKNAVFTMEIYVSGIDLKVGDRKGKIGICIKRTMQLKLIINEREGNMSQWRQPWVWFSCNTVIAHPWSGDRWLP